jgi:hypothetical protein
VRLVPLLREDLDERHRDLLAAGLELEAGLLGLDGSAPEGLVSRGAGR